MKPKKLFGSDPLVGFADRHQELGDVGNVINDLSIAASISVLTENTRKNRKGLLLASSILLLVVLAGIVPTEIGALGVRFNPEDQRYMVFGGSLVVGYFFVMFVVLGFQEARAWRATLNNAQQAAAPHLENLRTALHEVQMELDKLVGGVVVSASLFQRLKTPFGEQHIDVVARKLRYYRLAVFHEHEDDAKAWLNAYDQWIVLGAWIKRTYATPILIVEVVLPLAIACASLYAGFTWDPTGVVFEAPL